MAMYKYNGWTLPGLPTEWNQVTHPYAVILRARESGVYEVFQLRVSSLPFVVKVVNGVQVIALPCEASTFWCFWGGESEQWLNWTEQELEHVENCQFHYVAASTNDTGLSYDWAWCNESIRDDSNNVVYPGSVPILIEEPEPEPEPEAYDKQSFLNGLAAALCSMARAFYKKQMYLYGHKAKDGETPTHTINGVGYVGKILPKLPEYPDEAYKHKFIKCQGNSIRAYVTDVELKFRIDNSGAEMLVWEMNDSGAYKTFKEIYAQLKTSQGIVDAPEWRNLGSTTYISHFDSLLWSNYDILDESRTLILEASDPIPIYE